MIRTKEKTKGQVTQDFALALAIMLIFITLVLAAESEVLPKILNKQQAQYEKAKNIYRCSVIDTAATFKTQGITLNATNGTCLAHSEKIASKIGGYSQFEPYKERG